MRLDCVLKNVMIAGSLALLTSNAHSKPSILTADDTLKSSERQVVMGIAHLGLETQRFRFPITYCSFRGSCIPLGTWSAKIDQAFANQVLADNLNLLIPSRFDHLISQQNQLSLLTAQSRINAIDSPIVTFETGTTDYYDYKRSLTHYLNQQIAPQLIDLLGDAAQSRYLEMNNQEKDNFIRDKANQIGMPIDALDRLISTGFAFGLYLPKIDGSLRVQQIKRTLFDGREIYAFQTSLTAPLKTRLIILQFDGKQFSLAHEISATSDGNLFNAAAQQISGSGSVETFFLPSTDNVQQVFNDIFKLSFKDATLALSTKLKEIRDFTVATPVLASDKSGQFALRVGVQEDIRVDHPFTFNRKIDGQEQQVGWGQVRKSGDNCLVLPESERTYSQATLVQGSVNELDLAIEHPWTGVYGRAGISSSDTSLERNGNDTGAGAATFLEFGFIGNLGYILNDAELSEVWANFDMGIGGTSDGSSGNISLSSDTAARIRFGAEKRFHLMQGLYAAAGGDFAIEAHNYKISNSTDPLKVSTYNLIPRAELGYFFNPNTKFYGGVAYNLPISTSIENSNDDYEMVGGLSFNLGFAMHVNFAGPFAKMMAKPSSRCDVLREQANSLQ